MFSHHRIAAILRRIFRRREAAPVAVAVKLVPLELPSWAAWAEDAPKVVAVERPRAYRPLAAQLATQARLNVPCGRKPFVASKPARPIKSANIKRLPSRGVGHVSLHLPQRDLIAVSAPAAREASIDTGLSAYAGPRLLDLAA